ncbi:hypothetical protein [Lactobacillus sp.]|uniref:hypothetical protein n=1 Tax=Lactobacillus sp. TaxID=1591 RepID=UPI0019A790A5|nr:hypothetical protein [Lactobacillus sp.]MBD5429682.1 hypothetical protein [Lactobacillus sp.]
MRRIKKQYTRHFTTIDNQVLNDSKISFGAIGLFSYLWAQADTFDFYISAIVKHSDKDGRTKVEGYLKELEMRGYLTRTKKRVKGQFNGYEWILTDHLPQRKSSKAENTISVKTDDGKTVDGKSAAVNKQLINTNQTITNQINTKSNNNQSLSNNTEREKENKNYFLAQMVKLQFESCEISVSDKELDKIAIAVANKNARAVHDELYKALALSNQYPVGYFLSCVNNLPDMEVSND